MSDYYKHLVIGGANKCGTTSLFRYLADHPRICGSKVKEADFFNQSEISLATYQDYLDIFPATRGPNMYLLEGTPSYLDGGQATAAEVKRLIPEAQLIFVLRNPADRLVSFYRSKIGLTTSISHGMSLDQFADLALNIATGKVQPDCRQQRNIGWQVSKAAYASFLQDYLRFFDASQINVVLFDDFRDNPKSVVSDICRSLDLDDAYLDNYDFTIENKSRAHRNETIRTLGSKLNRNLEPLLNRIPAVRRFARATYNRLNTTDSDGVSLSPTNQDRLSDYFAPHNDALRILLEAEFGFAQFPGWLYSQ